MKKRVLSTTVLAVFLILLSMGALTPQAIAAAELQVVQVVPGEAVTTFFLNSAVDSAAAACCVSNQEAPILKTGSLSDENAQIRTTVLMDVSGSMPKTMREKVMEALDKLIERKRTNESYRLITFAQEERVLCDFTADRYDLGKAVESIAFDGQWSTIYDAIYNAIPQVEDSGEELPPYSRILVVTDGVDETKVGVTMEELFLKLQNEHCPVDVLAVSGQTQSTPSKELSGIARISGGRYSSLDPDTSLDDMLARLSVENFSYLQAQVPEHLLDGSVRQVDLTLGENTITLDVKFPASFVQQEPEPNAPVETPKPKPDAVPEPDTNPEPAFLERYGMACAIGAVAAIAILAVVLIVALRGKKEKTAPGGGTDKIPTAPRRPTEKLSETAPLIEDALYTVKFSAPEHPEKVWTLEVTDSILIGRTDYCDLQLEDGTVSREHCRVEAHSDGLVLVHLGSNTTRVNGMKVADSTPLASGDLLKLGREQLKVDYIQKLDGPEDFAAGASKGDHPTFAIFEGRPQ